MDEVPPDASALTSVPAADAPRWWRELHDLMIPGCAPWRQENSEALCPSVHCGRCQNIRILAGLPVLEPYVGGIDG